MVPKPLRGFVAFPTAALERLPHANLCPVSVLRVILYTIHVLQQENDSELDTQPITIQKHNYLHDYFERMSKSLNTGFEKTYCINKNVVFCLLLGTHQCN